MAHFAKIENGIVTQIIVVANEDCGGGNFPDSEAIGQQFIANLGLSGTWLQTSYNNNFRGKFAGIGDVYDNKIDMFVISDEHKAQIAELEVEYAQQMEKREAVIAALAAAAGLEVDEVKAVLG